MQEAVAGVGMQAFGEDELGLVAGAKGVFASFSGGMTTVSMFTGSPILPTIRMTLVGLTSNAFRILEEEGLQRYQWPRSSCKA